MLKCTLNSAPRLIPTKNLNFERDELTVADYLNKQLHIIDEVIKIDSNKILCLFQEILGIVWRR